MFVLAVILFGLLSDTLLSVLVGMVGRTRRIGFGWTFVISLIFTPLVGLIFALISDPLPADAPRRWGCVGTVIALLGLLFLAGFLLLLLSGGAILAGLA